MTQSLIMVPFRADPQKLRSRMLPKPLEPVGDGDIGWVFMVDTGDARAAGGGRMASRPTRT